LPLEPAGLFDELALLSKATRVSAMCRDEFLELTDRPAADALVLVLGVIGGVRWRRWRRRARNGYRGHRILIEESILCPLFAPRLQVVLDLDAHPVTDTHRSASPRRPFCLRIFLIEHLCANFFVLA